MMKPKKELIITGIVIVVLIGIFWMLWLFMGQVDSTPDEYEIGKSYVIRYYVDRLSRTTYILQAKCIDKVDEAVYLIFDRKVDPRWWDRRHLADLEILGVVEIDPKVE